MINLLMQHLLSSSAFLSCTTPKSRRKKISLVSFFKLLITQKYKAAGNIVDYMSSGRQSSLPVVAVI